MRDKIFFIKSPDIGYLKGAIEKLEELTAGFVDRVEILEPKDISARADEAIAVFLYFEDCWLNRFSTTEPQMSQKILPCLRSVSKSVPYLAAIIITSGTGYICRESGFFHYIYSDYEFGIIVREIVGQLEKLVEKLGVD